MKSSSIDLETVNDFYNAFRYKNTLTEHQRSQLVKYTNQLRIIVFSQTLKGGGHKAAKYLWEKLTKLEQKHRVKREVRETGGNLFNN